MAKFVLAVFAAMSALSISATANYKQDCVITYDLLYLIAKNERHPKRAVGYPYLISFNKKQDRHRLKPEHKKLMIDNRTLDCQNKELCTEISSYLINQHVSNMDLGGFQICYTVHNKKMRLEQFFSLKDSFAFAKEFSEQNVKRKGCTWKGLAYYHSGTKKYNEKYAKGLKDGYEKIR